ncbi:MAG: sigma-70 family RNA polymerase sigma factor [Gemmatimonadota bacterium]
MDDSRLAELGRRLRAGDVAAFDELFRTFNAPLCEVVDSYVHSQDVAEDAVQELFFALWTRRATIETPSLRAYLFAAARNRGLQHIRHQSVVVRWIRRALHDQSVSGTTPVPRPDEILQADERAAALRDAIDRLPPRTRLALVLHWEHQMTQAEVATAMGISVKGVEKLLAIARRRLRERLGAHSDDGLALIPPAH